MGKKGKSKSTKNNLRNENTSIAAGMRSLAEQNRMNDMTESFAKMADMDRHPLTKQKVIIRKSLVSIGTDCDKNDADPAGNGDQSMITSTTQAEAARELYSIGGDIHPYLTEGAFSHFGMNCVIGNVAAIRVMIDGVTNAIKKFHTEPWYCYCDSREGMITLLETRDTSMRLSPLLLIVSAGKNVVDQPHMDHKGAAKLLLKSGANPYAKDVLGKTAAHYGAGAMATPMTLEVVDMCILAARSSHLLGKDVELHSLKVNMNGSRGVAGGFDPDSGRRVVYLSEDKKEVWVKPDNIRLVAVENTNQPKMLLDVQDRTGSVSLHEVVMQNRIDVAEFLLMKHQTSIHTEDMDGISPMRMSTRGGRMTASGVSKIISKVTRRAEAEKFREGKKQAKERTCANCKKYLGEVEKKKCAGCKTVTYCGRECQVAHWSNGHKAECKTLKVIAKGVKLKAPSGEYAFNASVSLVSGKPYTKGHYRIPDGTGTGAQFVVKVQGGSETMPIMVYDKTRTCEFTIPPGQPGFKEVLTEMKKEMAWGGRKTFMKASFDDSGACTIYPATAGVKEKYSW
mmetsp:Transcript_10421/g.12684  ORF Transcript_10421/g.12684 Transcript_10421/m.12684 type:complete len:566 (+) Transcript_10421:34-1731(+)